ncbi:hypothetical protein PABG_11282 [Paracoccidioides brasiliensis Pb03]|uniref:Uncharacterized protein n=1 Tax=Paracoccidioides brasiliensis TaxID=121759 RepID=A0A1D2JHQ0_PARBR|nr:hypothetical protein PABG_11282 [Paracoccidioides brasiliensis Pb03]ODH35824.1 hypothetical protein ACO22_02889 [Paracoccidioides brasiliensis]
MGWELFGHQAVRKGRWKTGSRRTRDLSEENAEKLQESLHAWDEFVKEVGVVGAAPQYGVLRVDATIHRSRLFGDAFTQKTIRGHLNIQRIQLASTTR